MAHPEVLFDTVCLVEVQMFLGSLTQLGGLRELVWISRQEAGLGNEMRLERSFPNPLRGHILPMSTLSSPEVVSCGDGGRPYM